MEKYGFVYIWRDRKHNRYYIGSHWGTGSDGYLCSSRWMRAAYKRRPEDFKRRIIETTTERGELISLEHKWLQLISENELGKRYYNLKNHRFGHWSEDENKRLTVPQKSGKALREKYKTEPHPWTGRKHSEETKKKQSDVKKGVKLGSYSEERMAKHLKAMKDRKRPERFTDEHRANLSKSQKGNKNSVGNQNHLGHKRTEGSKASQSETMKGRYIGEKNPFYGRKHSPETIAKIKATQLRNKVA